MVNAKYHRLIFECENNEGI